MAKELDVYKDWGLFCPTKELSKLQYCAFGEVGHSGGIVSM